MAGNAESKDIVGSGLGRRHIRSHGNVSADSSSSILDVQSNGAHGLTETTQSYITISLKNFINKTLLPSVLILFIPNLVIIMWFTVIHCDGSYLEMLSFFSNGSVFGELSEMWNHVHNPSAPIIGTLIIFSIYAIAMMKILPGATVFGPITPKGNIPVYKDNGFLYFLVTFTLFWVLTILLYPSGISPSIIYDRFDEVLFALNIFSLVFCGFLYFKGKFFPSSSDSGSSGNIIFDYYWGMELYPRVFDFDVKVFTNCRFGLMVWALLVCVNVVKSYELHGFVDSMFVSAFLQLLYLLKFFWWESGYLQTIDIMLDRAGFYICWGCLVYVPGMYTLASFYLVNHPINLGPVVSGIILLLGTLSIYINYNADNQKQVVRDTDGNCLIWGRKANIIRARYHLENGDVRESILLVSGWWSLSRHFHYIPEIMLAFFWSVTALFSHILPYSYVIFLTVLLTHRSFRDDEKCAKKYGIYWQHYCEKVPYKIVPYIF